MPGVSALRTPVVPPSRRPVILQTDLSYKLVTLNAQLASTVCEGEGVGSWGLSIDESIDRLIDELID